MKLGEKLTVVSSVPQWFSLPTLKSHSDSVSGHIVVVRTFVGAAQS
jgi:hypothetical protein